MTHDVPYVIDHFSLPLRVTVKTVDPATIVDKLILVVIAYEKLGSNKLSGLNKKRTKHTHILSNLYYCIISNLFYKTLNIRHTNKYTHKMHVYMHQPTQERHGAPMSAQ